MKASKTWAMECDINGPIWTVSVKAPKEMLQKHYDKDGFETWEHTVKMYDKIIDTFTMLKKHAQSKRSYHM